jgi:DNA invertase Pin-like site-specific DNA recombinase
MRKPAPAAPSVSTAYSSLAAQLAARKATDGPVVVTYARVSSDGQRDKHTIGSQLVEIPAGARAKGFRVLEPACIDDGLTASVGHSEDRPGFQALLALVPKLRPGDAIAVVDIDRLSRSIDPGERTAWISVLYKAGVKVIVTSEDEVIDPRTDDGDRKLTMAGFVAAEEKRRIVSRTQRGKRKALAHGKPISGNLPYGIGYAAKAAEPWFLVEPAASVIREAFERFVAGESLYRIEQDFEARCVARRGGGGWRGRLRFLLANPCYRGDLVLHSKSNARATVPRTVSDELWDAAQVRLAEATAGKGERRMATKHVNMLEGICRCACGSTVRVTGRGLGFRYYSCSDKVKDGKNAERCRNRMRPVAALESLVWEKLRATIEQDPEVLAALLEERSAERAPDHDWALDVAEYEGKLAEIERKRGYFTGLLRRNLISETTLEENLAELSKSRAFATRQRDFAASAATKAKRDLGEMDALRVTMGGLRVAMGTATPEERRAICRALAIGLADDGKALVTLEMQEGGRGAGPLTLLGHIMPDTKANLEVLPCTMPSQQDGARQNMTKPLSFRVVIAV